MIVKGQKVNDRYEVIKSIGEGGMANVYLAKDTILDRNVAIKVLRGDLSGDEKFVRRFQREALSASSLSHPNIVEIYDVGEDNGDYFIVMEYVKGLTLKQLLKKRGKLTTSEVIDIMLQITSAMGVAHDSLIIHRDLKPQNILIEDDGGIKITDFGIAMALNATQLTQTNSAMGSVHYFSPEQASGKGASLKSDVYSLGIMMYELLTGSLPFKGDTAVEIALKHLKEPVPSIRDVLPDLPQSVENIIISSTAKNPKNRYNNANEMHNDLLTVLNKERLNEPKRKLKYKEGDLEEKEIVDDIENLDNSFVKTIKEEDEDKKNKKIVLLGIIFSILVVICAFVFLVLPKLTKVPDVKIPDVSNLTEAAAEQLLEEKGLKVKTEIEEESSSTVEKGLVIGTSPSKDRTVKKGTEITLIVSTGEETFTIEDYTGKNASEIKGKLEAYGITVTIEEQEIDDKDKVDTIKYEENLIIGQNVDPETTLKKNDKITLYITKIENKYPDIVGESWTLEETQNWAKEKEITLKIKYKSVWDQESGIIIEQDRKAGSIIVKGAVLTITVTEKSTEEIPEENDEEIKEEE